MKRIIAILATCLVTGHAYAADPEFKIAAPQQFVITAKACPCDTACPCPASVCDAGQCFTIRPASASALVQTAPARDDGTCVGSACSPVTSVTSSYVAGTSGRRGIFRR